jgi:hypothetical protein
VTLPQVVLDAVIGNNPEKYSLDCPSNIPEGKSIFQGDGQLGEINFTNYLSDS